MEIYHIRFIAVPVPVAICDFKTEDTHSEVCDVISVQYEVQFSWKWSGFICSERFYFSELKI